MTKVHNGLYVGKVANCRVGDREWAVVHACKSPCHQRAVGYHGSLSRHHPNYLVLERGTDLFLNLIDPPKPLFMAPSFHSFLAFSRVQVEEGRKILIHCNQGESRAPSLALLLLAKMVSQISNESFGAARAEFDLLFNSYKPGLGIQKYLADHWSEFNASVASR